MLFQNRPSPTVLIIEDEAIVAEDLAFKVKSLGYQVVAVVRTGEEALRVVQHAPADLILLDIQLSGHIDGVEVANRLQKLCDPAIVFVTAHSDPETIKKANATSPYGYILKPFGERDLAVQLTIALHKHRADRALKEQIAERKRAEQNLRKSEELLLRAQRGAKAGVWEIDLRTGRITWSKPYYDLFGLNHSLQPSFELWFSCIHPEDQARIAAEYHRSLTEHSDHNMEFRIVKADGSVRWIQRQGKVEFNEQGEALCIIGISLDITDHKQTEEAFSAIALFPEQNPSPVLRVSAAGVLLYMNAASDRLLREIHLQPGQGVPQYLQDLVNQTLHNERSEQFELTIGSCYYLISIAPIVKEQYANLYLTDITERKRAEAALRESQQRLERVLETDAVGVLFFDHSGTLINANEVFLRQTGYRREQIDRRELHWRTLTPPEWIEASENQMQKFAQTGRVGPYEIEYYLADGSRRWMLFAGRDLGDGTIAEYCVDIHEKKEAQFCLEHFAQELERQVTARTSELLQSQERLRALATELNLAEQRERKQLAEQLHDHLQQMLVLGKLKVAQGKKVFPASDALLKQLDEIFSEALTYTRTLVTELSPPVLREYGLTAAVKWLSEYMQKYDLVVHVSMPENIPLDLPEDQKLLLFQSVRELLINTSKHSGTHEAAVKIQRREGVLEIEVRDRGIGFDCAAVATSPKAIMTGSLSSKFGLLSINERMRALGGTLDIQSSPGKGTVATLSLPLTVTAREAVMLDHQLTLPSLDYDHNERISVLLVDDHPMMRQGLRAVLASYDDVQVIAEASTVKEAITLVDHLHPQVVIMDINLPMHNGIEATAEIQACHPQVKVIGLSVNSSANMVSAMLKAGAVALLNKESAGEHLYGAIKEAVKIQQPVPTSSAETSEPVH